MKIKELQLERYGIYQEETWRPSLSLIHISEPTRRITRSRMPSSA